MSRKRPHPDLGLLARALIGDGEACLLAARSDQLIALAEQERIAPLLALLCHSEEIEVPGIWRDALHRSIATHELLKRSESIVEEILTPLGIDWAPIKGADLAYRCYQDPAMRPTRDLDILVRREDFDAVREALLEAEFDPLHSGPRVERYLREEGYAWQAMIPSGLLLEVHYRLWGMVPESFAEAALSTASPMSGSPPNARRLRPNFAYILAATHLWTVSPRPRMIDLFDLHQLLAMPDGADAEGIAQAADAHDLQLPVALAAQQVDALWPDRGHRSIVERLIPALKARESRILRLGAESEGPHSTYASIVLARLLAGRKSRQGWRSLWRRVWPHAGVVQMETSEHLPWPLRRVAHLTRRLRMSRSAHILDPDLPDKSSNRDAT